MHNDEIYLDSAATTKPDNLVLEDIAQSMIKDWHNPSSVYEAGLDVKRKIEHARDQVRSFLGADDTARITFCSNGSEANNLAINGFFEANDFPVLITTEMEHPSIYVTALKLAQTRNVKFCKVDEYGRMDLESLERLLRMFKDHSILIATSMVNNETGLDNAETIIGIRSLLYDLCEEGYNLNVYTMVDMAQSVYHKLSSVEKFDIDIATFTFEKMGGVRGCGVMYSRYDVNIAPQIVGGHQENGLRAGTENQAAIIALGNQCKRLKYMLSLTFDNESFMSIRDIEVDIGNRLCEEIKNACLGICDYHFSLPAAIAVPNIISVRFDGYDSQQLLSLLDENGVMCSAGSACSSREAKPSRVLKAMGLTDEEAKSTLRFSFDHRFDMERIEEFGDILRKCLVMLRDLNG